MDYVTLHVLDIMRNPDDSLAFRAFSNNPAVSTGERVRLPMYLYSPHREVLSLDSRDYDWINPFSVFIRPRVANKPLFSFFDRSTVVLASDPVSTDFIPYGYSKIPELAEGQVVSLISKKFSDGSYDLTTCTVERLLVSQYVDVRLPDGDILQVPRNRLLAEGETVETPLFKGDVVRRTSDGLLCSLLSRQPYGWNGVDKDGNLVVVETGGFETVFSWSNHTIGTVMPDGSVISSVHVSDANPLRACIVFDSGRIVSLEEILK